MQNEMSERSVCLEELEGTEGTAHKERKVEVEDMRSGTSLWDLNRSNYLLR